MHTWVEWVDLILYNTKQFLWSSLGIQFNLQTV